MDRHARLVEDEQLMPAALQNMVKNYTKVG